MTQRMEFKSLFLWGLVVLIGLASVPSEMARAGGSYVYYDDSYATPGWIGWIGVNS